jgi:MFS family permease
MNSDLEASAASPFNAHCTRFARIWLPAMSNDAKLTSTNLRTPKAAAIAGILFSILTITIFWLLRSSFPSQPSSALATLNRSATTIAFAIYLVPFAGVVFLWFIGVLRDRLGRREDQFFATVFLGSGLLFLAMFFSAAAIVGSIVAAFATNPDQSINPETFVFVRSLAFDLMNVFAIKMAAVFMISTSMVIARTRAAPRYLAYLGALSGLFILVASQSLDWAFLVFPIWVLLFSTQVLADNFRRPAELPSRSP